MYKIQTLNKISAIGLNNFPRDNYEIASEFQNPDAVIVRSFGMLEMDIPASVKSIARAGAGVNNIPIPKCTEKGIVVFNTPGANANAVKELVFAGMFLSARNLFDSMKWTESVKGKGDEVPKLVEKEKSKFAGSEIKGKTLGVIGLGAIGVMVSNDAIAMGMNVIGFDPYISVDNAWGLDSKVHKAISLDHLLSESDYITVHVPLTDGTRGMFNAEKFKLVKDGAVLLNFSRGGLINNADLKAAIETGKIKCHVTDFPEEELIGSKGIICLPHLGASTEEAEDNCAVMAVKQTKDFLETGNIKNSVNFPDCDLPFSNKCRLIIANKNVPNMVGQITTRLAEKGINISDMINKHKGEIAYNIIDLDTVITDEQLAKIKAIDGIIMVRFLENPFKK